MSFKIAEREEYKVNKTHKIKILDKFATSVYVGMQTFEIRKNDRDYKLGDFVIFDVIYDDGTRNEKHPLNDKEYIITYVISGWGLKDGYVAFGISELMEEIEDE